MLLLWNKMDLKSSSKGGRFCLTLLENEGLICDHHSFQNRVFHRHENGQQLEDFVGGICSRCMEVSVHVLSSRDLFFKKRKKQS